ncbi:MAG: archaetidylserine decarboxylase [Pseudomonadota bacterium]|nr:archaetidylserine decarboxylase [Pseudomonadota bacterium]
MGLVVFFLQFLPKLLLSRALGFFASIRFPAQIQHLVAQLFVNMFGIDMREAEKELKDYRSIQEVFSRRLRTGAREITSEFCSPVDGMLNNSQSPNGILGFQAKGYYYSLRELIYGADAIDFDFEPAWHMTFYLAPHNYHRVHAPFAGEILSERWITGERWSVNEGFRKTVTRLYARNERKIFHLMHTATGGRAYLVMVAAFGVGNMVVTAYDCENYHKNVSLRVLLPSVSLKAGQELAYFAFGSTVILVCDQIIADHCNFITARSDAPVRVGTSLLKHA